MQKGWSPGAERGELLLRSPVTTIIIKSCENLKIKKKSTKPGSIRNWSVSRIKEAVLSITEKSLEWNPVFAHLSLMDAERCPRVVLLD